MACAIASSSSIGIPHVFNSLFLNVIFDFFSWGSDERIMLCILMTHLWRLRDKIIQHAALATKQLTAQLVLLCSITYVAVVWPGHPLWPELYPRHGKPEPAQ